MHTHTHTGATLFRYKVGLEIVLLFFPLKNTVYFLKLSPHPSQERSCKAQQ